MSPEQLIMQQYQTLAQQAAALQQPAPRQGGILGNADPVMLSLAAGLLSPTKTGGFGESIGAGLEAVQSPLAEMRRQEAARADKLSALQNAQAKLAMDLYEIRTGGRRGYRPEDPNLIYNRYLDNRARLKSEIESEQNPEEKLRLQEQLSVIDEEAKTIFPSKQKKSEGGDDSGKSDGADASGEDAGSDPLANIKYQGPYPKVQTEEQYNALPSGTRYIHPKTGTIKTKP